MKPFAYASPGSLDDALRLLARDGGRDGRARPLAGGTDLLTLMKAGLLAPAGVIDIKRAGLPRGIVSTRGGVVVGALATLADIEESRVLRERYPALAEAAAVAATPQLRNMATLGGNLLQRPRCWYFRSPHLSCWLKGGEDCPAREGENQLHAILGGGPCHAVHPSDLAPALVSLDAEVELQAPRGSRTLPVADLFALPEDARRTETRLAPDELIVSVRLPAAAAGPGSTYLKAMDRQVWAFALVGAAARLRMERGRIADARLTLSGVASVPWRAEEAERVLVGADPTEALFDRAAEAAVGPAAPLRQNRYKIPLARALVRRALAAAAAA